MKGTRERRVTLALKWHYLDHLETSEIQERFAEEGYGELALSTIRGYLNEAPREEVLEQIRDKHVETREQILERQEELYQRARADERRATKDEPIQAVVPVTDTVTKRDAPLEMPAWEFVDEGDEDWPEWAAEHDTIIRFVDGTTRLLEAGEEYPVRRLDDSPQYRTTMVGVERDVPDLQGRAMARREQQSHLQAKGEAAGVYSQQLEIDLDGEVEHTGEELAEEARELRERLGAAIRGDVDVGVGDQGETDS